jgi:hypothetical protein
MLPMSVKAKAILTFSTLVIVALSLVFAVSLIVANQKAFAANLCGSGFCERHTGISYPSPLSQFFGGDVLHHRGHWHYSHGSGHGHWYDSHHSHGHSHHSH